MKGLYNEEQRLALQAEEIAFWKAIAPVYPIMMTGRPYKELAKKMAQIADPKPNEVWLDAGTGPGTMSKILWEKSGKNIKKIIATDIALSPEIKKIQEEIPVMELRIASLTESLDIKDSSLDGIISNIALPYTFEFEGVMGKEGIKLLFKELSRTLKPGGRIIWSTPKKDMNTKVNLIGAVSAILKNIHKPHFIEKVKILAKYGKELEIKGKEGVYTYLYTEEWDTILKDAELDTYLWDEVFWHQTIVNKAIKG